MRSVSSLLALSLLTVPSPFTALCSLSILSLFALCLCSPFASHCNLSLSLSLFTVFPLKSCSGATGRAQALTLQCLVSCEFSDFVGLPNLTHGSKLRLVLGICLSQVVSLVSTNLSNSLYTRYSVLAGGGIGGGFSSASSGVVKPLRPSRF
jgi:hypothetical protein